MSPQETVEAIIAPAIKAGKLPRMAWEILEGNHERNLKPEDDMAGFIFALKNAGFPASQCKAIAVAAVADEALKLIAKE